MQLLASQARNIKKTVEKASSRTNESRWEEKQMSQSKKATNKEKAYPLDQLL
jgi:hypothetical protein